MRQFIFLCFFGTLTACGSRDPFISPVAIIKGTADCVKTCKDTLEHFADGQTITEALYEAFKAAIEAAKVWREANGGQFKGAEESILAAVKTVLQKYPELSKTDVDYILNEIQVYIKIQK